MYNRIEITAATNKGSREENEDNFRMDTRIPYTTEEYMEITEEIERDDRIHLVCV